MSADDVVYGQHAVASVLDTSAERVREVWLQRGRENRLSARLRDRFEQSDVPVHLLSRPHLDQLLEGARHQGVAVRVAPGATLELKGLVRKVNPDTLLVLLDGIQDPRNVGAVLRSAAAVGVQAVVYPRSRGAGLTPAARKTAAGAAERVPVVEVANLVRAMGSLTEAGVQLIGLAADADVDLFDTDLRGPLGLVLGAEDTGLRRLTREHCQHLARLPMVSVVESLNVSVAAGVCLYEALRQRRPGSSRAEGRDSALSC